APAADEPRFPLSGRAERAGLSLPVLAGLAPEASLIPRAEGPAPLYHPEDPEALRAGLALVGAGPPLAELPAVARQADEARRPVAEAAVDAFVRFVPDPAEGTAHSEEEAAQRMVGAFEKMLPAAGRLVAHHFQSLLVDGA